ncbi:MAG: hypothetical protein ACR2QC_07810 [Gammaproteobacteria bacterium]
MTTDPIERASRAMRESDWWFLQDDQMLSQTAIREYKAWLTEQGIPIAKLLSEGTDVADLQRRKDEAYHERNKVVAVLARLFPSGVAKTNIEDWSPEWHSCVYIDLPTGQVSWHFHDSQTYLFEGLPAYQGKWDGHTTEEKYNRLFKLLSGEMVAVTKDFHDLSTQVVAEANDTPLVQRWLAARHKALWQARADQERKRWSGNRSRAR